MFFYLKLSVMVNDIVVLGGANSGGFARFKFVPIEDVKDIEYSAYDTIVDSIVLVENKRFFDAYVTPDTLGFDELSGSNDAGVFYRPLITGFVPGDGVVLSALMDVLMDHKFIVLVYDYFGKQRMVGSLKQPLSFGSDFIGSDKKNKIKGYNIRFSGESYKRAPFIGL